MVDLLKAMKAELEIDMEARLASMENSLKELKKMISDCKTKVKFVDDLVNMLIRAELDNDPSIDDEIMAWMVEEATRALTEAMRGSASSELPCPTAAGNGGGKEGSSSDGD
ncbi:uncharacterized protein LOC120133624 [Hibiscus syriacus]|uniref:uncharacterized protein LOC120133624 n=1 Tax=Hibiscus syriacus TaxID=106335 RepID=UPI001921E7FD|nr:uncharacterized protein LOC120133624 [Hibiscus syriacus]